MSFVNEEREFPLFLSWEAMTKLPQAEPLALALDVDEDENDMELDDENDMPRPPPTYAVTGVCSVEDAQIKDEPDEDDEEKAAMVRTCAWVSRHHFNNNPQQLNSLYKDSEQKKMKDEPNDYEPATVGWFTAEEPPTCRDALSRRSL
jgi:hypothetical protein